MRPKGVLLKYKELLREAKRDEQTPKDGAERVKAVKHAGRVGGVGLPLEDRSHCWKGGSKERRWKQQQATGDG